MADAKRDFEALLRRLAAPDRGSVGDTLGPPLASAPAWRYRMIRLLGRGGMGEVYEVEDTQTGVRLALKCLRHSLVENEVARLRIEAEGQLAGRLDHPNIVQVFDAGELPDGRPYLCMELLPGRSLQRIVDEDGALPEPRLSSIARALCDALSAAHAKQLIHRDLKPSNVILVATADGSEAIKLADFGIAKHVRDPAGYVTTTGVLVGTPHFMSAEQLRGDRDLDGRSDVYSLGVLLYYCATGAFPFQGRGFAELALQICTGTVRSPRTLRPTLSPEFEQVIEVAMAREPERRFASAAALKAALERAECARQRGGS